MRSSSRCWEATKNRGRSRRGAGEGGFSFRLEVRTGGPDFSESRKPNARGKRTWFAAAAGPRTHGPRCRGARGPARSLALVHEKASSREVTRGNEVSKGLIRRSPVATER